MSRQVSRAGSQRINAASPAVSRRSGMSKTFSGGIGVDRNVGELRASRSAPTLQKQLDSMGGSGVQNSHVLGTMAKTLGAKISSTLHHRGEHEVGAIVDPNDEHVYVPRAMWTQSHDHPLKANNASWNKQHFVADELKRLHGEAKKKEYIQQNVDRQLQERSDARTRARNEKEAFAKLVNDDAKRHEQDQLRLKAEANKTMGAVLSGLQDQNNELARRAHEARVRDAHEAAEIKMRTVQQMCEEMAEHSRKKKQAALDNEVGMRNIEAKKARAKVEKAAEDEKCRKEIRDSLMQDEYRNQATQKRIAEKQEHQDHCIAVYEKTAGVYNKAREQAELTRIDNDEKKHLMRTDAFFSQRERARERQRQQMVQDLDRQMASREQKKQNDQLIKQAEREAVQAATKRSMDAELAKAMAKKAEEQQLQQELRIMMLEREERDAREEFTKPASVSTMQTVMRKNGNAYNTISSFTNSMDASRFVGKPLGREDRPGEQRAVPLDASPHVIRKLTKDSRSKGEIPHGTVLGGVVGTLGGGGGSINCALMATGGPFMPKSVGLVMQDRKLDSAWYEGLRPEHLEAGRREARRRELAKAEANRDTA